MKKIILVLAVLSFPFLAVAKYNAPKGIVSRSDKIANWQVETLDKDGDGKLSIDEFKKKTENYGRDERRNVRRAQKEGIYMTPEQQFKAMDTDEDGLVSDEEMAEYVRKQRDSTDGLYY